VGDHKKTTTALEEVASRLVERIEPEPPKA
jgi:hypothetical protein